MNGGQKPLALCKPPSRRPAFAVRSKGVADGLNGASVHECKGGFDQSICAGERRPYCRFRAGFSWVFWLSVMPEHERISHSGMAKP